MLIAQLFILEYETSWEDNDNRPMYCATDPFDGEMLSGWKASILEVDEALLDLETHWGLPLRSLVEEGYDVYPEGNDPCCPMAKSNSNATSDSAIPCS